LVAQGNSYIPGRGDIVRLNFNPTQGHEQRGHRPALVISPLSYNAKSSLALFLPITSQQKGYPFEVLLPSGLITHGVILADQIKCLDWKARGVEFVEVIPDEATLAVSAKQREAVQAMLEALLL
jgi:mRNA interferase MazF